VANRGEIACRIYRACRKLNMKTVAIYAKEDADANHVLEADEKQLIEGATPIEPYLNIQEIIAIAKKVNADCIHPGYGFLAENVQFVQQCEAAGIKFVGPSSQVIDLFGDKTRSREFAEKHNVPVARGSPILASAEAAEQFLATARLRYPLLVKAVNGGGGRGQRLVRKPSDLRPRFQECLEEARLCFGSAALFIEEYVENARHIEVQILCDTYREVSHLFERDCSVQQRNQKVVEVTPARDIHPHLRKRLTDAATTLGKACGYNNAGTVEFLVSGNLGDEKSHFVFLEVNPRIQVEHTITEEVTHIDLVEAQLRIASGAHLKEVIPSSISLDGFAIQLRINAQPGPVDAKIGKYVIPKSVRMETSIREGGPVTLDYDPMLAKLIVKAPNFRACVAKAIAALDELVITGVKVNQDQLRSILTAQEFIDNRTYTTFLDSLNAKGKKKMSGKSGEIVKIPATFPGKVAELKVQIGQVVHPNDPLVVISAMKMLNEINADVGGTIITIKAKVEDQVAEGDVLLEIKSNGEVTQSTEDDINSPPLEDRIYDTQDSPFFTSNKAQAAVTTVTLRSKVKKDATFEKRKQINAQRAKTLADRIAEVKKAGSAKAIERHRKQGKYLPRERIEMICDKGTKFLELSCLAAWGMYDNKNPSANIVTGIGIVHGRQIMFIANDATCNGGAYVTETLKKHVRAQNIAEKNCIPCVYLVDGGGANLASTSEKNSQASVGFVDGGVLFKNQALMSSKRIPQIGVACGRCTAGGAYTAAMCEELIIVKENGAVYLGGPPLVKAATGEDCNEQDLGGALMHTSKSGTADHFAATEQEAFDKVRSIIEHLGPAYKAIPRVPVNPPNYDREDILGIIPEDNKIPYDVREVIMRIVDGSRFDEFKARYGPTIVCGFAHLYGFPIGIIGNNGMLFSDSSIKATHFIQLCGHRGIPIFFLQNITGFIIGTAYEQLGITKDGCKMVTAVSCVDVPKICIVLGGSHGAGNYAMCGPAFDPRFVFLWPNAKISVMGGEQAAGVIVSVKNGQLKRQGEPELPDEMVKMISDPIIDFIDGTATAYHSAAELYDDGIIDPRATREVLGMALSTCMNSPTFNKRGKAGPYGVFRQ